MECDITQLIITVRNGEYVSGIGSVMLIQPASEELHVNYRPRMDFWEYATLLGSVLGLWFGCSCFGLLEQAGDWQHKLRRTFTNRNAIDAVAAT